MRYTHDPIEDKLVHRFNTARHTELGAALVLFLTMPFLLFYGLLYVQLVVTTVTIGVCLIARRCWKHFEDQLLEHYASRLTFADIRVMMDGVVKRDVC